MYCSRQTVLAGASLRDATITGYTSSQHSHLPTDSLYHARTAPTSKLTTPFIKAQAARLEALGWNNMQHAYSLILIAIVNDFLKTDRGRVNVMTAFSGAPLMNIRVFRVLQP